MRDTFTTVAIIIDNEAIEVQDEWLEELEAAELVEEMWFSSYEGE